jgi:hypothetical protein
MKVYAGRFILILVLDAGRRTMENSWAFYFGPMCPLCLMIDEFDFDVDGCCKAIADDRD